MACPESVRRVSDRRRPAHGQNSSCARYERLTPEEWRCGEAAALHFALFHSQVDFAATGVAVCYAKFVGLPVAICHLELLGLAAPACQREMRPALRSFVQLVNMEVKMAKIIYLITVPLLAASVNATAQEKPFYEGKTIRIVVGFTSGGFYDRWSRLLARYVPKYIPAVEENRTIIMI